MRRNLYYMHREYPCLHLFCLHTYRRSVGPCFTYETGPRPVLKASSYLDPHGQGSPAQARDALRLRPGVIDPVSAAGDDLPYALFFQGRSRMVVPQMLEGHLHEPLVAVGSQGVAAVAQGGAQNRTHRGPFFLYGGLHGHLLLQHGRYPTPYHVTEVHYRLATRSASLK